MVSPAGFEPAIFPPQTECHTWLGYREMLFWSEQRDLNPQHTAWKAVALPVELCPQKRKSLEKIYWSGQRDSNPWHSRWQRDILPDWIMPAYMVGHKRIELSPQVPQTCVLTCYTNAHITFIIWYSRLELNQHIAIISRTLSH